MGRCMGQCVGGGAWMVVHEWLMMGWGGQNDVLNYRGIGEVGPEHWRSPGLGLVVMSLHMQNNTLKPQLSCIYKSFCAGVKPFMKMDPWGRYYKSWAHGALCLRLP